MHFTLLSCSLDRDSASRRLAELAVASLQAAGQHTTLIDLRAGNGLPTFDNETAFTDPRYATICAAIAAADGIVIASPVYNWGLSSAAKGLIELTGATGEAGRQSPWFDKLVTFLCAGGLPHSYMAYGATALALMLDFKCIVNPYQVYATDRDWSADGAPDARLAVRLEKTLAVKLELAERLRGRNFRSDWEV